MPKKARKRSCMYAAVTGCETPVKGGGQLCEPCKRVQTEIRRTIAAVLKGPPPKYTPRVYTVIRDH